MATTSAGIISEMRQRVGDTNIDSYFLSDTQWGNVVTAAVTLLKKYIQKEDEATITGDDTYDYEIPAGALNKDWSDIFIRDNDDPSTDRELKGFRVHNGKIYLNSTISSGQKLVIWVKRPFVLTTDTFTDDALEITYKLCEIGFINHAVHRRADFEQWAALNRGDSSINALLIAKQDLKRDLDDIARGLGDGMDVANLANYD